MTGRPPLAVRLTARTPDGREVTMEMAAEGWRDIEPVRMNRFRSGMLRELGRDPNKLNEDITWTLAECHQAITEDPTTRKRPRP